MNKISIFTRYDTLGASSRYRYFMYADRLRQIGVEAEISPFLDNIYLEDLYQGRNIAPMRIVKAYFKRFYAGFRAADNVILEYELLPYMPFWIGQLFLRKRRYILNFDDNVWLKYSDRMFLSKKFDRLVKRAAGIIVANDFLYQKVAAINDRVIKIPTVIDLNLYRCEKPKFEKFTVVWIGTPVTYKYLRCHADTLHAMASEVDFELLVLAKKELVSEKIPGVNMRFVDWSQELECELLARSHVGIMPLTDDDFSRGKSAFKIIQYLAAGIPVIASPIGENVNVLENGVNGFLPANREHWVSSLRRLAQDSGFYNTMAAAAKESAEKYSIQKYFPVFLDFINKTFFH
ncbi:MAG: glycosyltransferase [Victivallaceae bacterium]